MPLIIGKIKCCFCENVDGLIESVPTYGIYGEIGKRIFFHDKCLESIQEQPEKFSHIFVDKAIDIQDRIENAKHKNERIVKRFKDKVEKLQAAHFERMMPKGK